jgi:hypothetical protein
VSDAEFDTIFDRIKKAGLSISDCPLLPRAAGFWPD